MKISEQFLQLDEDAYASRLVARDQINIPADFNRKLGKPNSGGVLNTRRTITNYGYDQEAAAAQVEAIAFFPDGGEVLTNLDNRTAILWRSDNGKTVSTLEAPPPTQLETTPQL